MSAKKVYGFLTQAFIFAVIMLVSNMIAAIVQYLSGIGCRVGLIISPIMFESH